MVAVGEAGAVAAHDYRGDIDYSDCCLGLQFLNESLLTGRQVDLVHFRRNVTSKISVNGRVVIRPLERDKRRLKTGNEMGCYATGGGIDNNSLRA